MKDQEFYHIIEKYLTDEINSEEQSRLEAWLSHSPENQEYLDKMQNYWDLYGKLKPALEIDSGAAFDALQSRINNSKSGSSSNWGTFMKIAASVVLVLGLGYLFYTLNQGIDTTSYETADVSQEITLPDGSVVTLNANSSIEFPEGFEGNIRSISLVGEAFFEVEKDASKPFIIDADETQVKVLGTSFNVQAYEESGAVEVSVKTGKVGFYKKGEEAKMLSLLPGDFATFNKQRSIISLEVQEDPNYLYWKDQELEFKDTPLNEVFSTIEEHFKIKFSIKNKDILNCTLTSSFDGASIEEILEVISLSLNLEFNENQKVYEVTGEGCSS